MHGHLYILLLFKFKMFNKSPKFIFYFLYFAALTLITIHFILNLGLSYTDENGCYRAYMSSAANLTTIAKTYFDSLQNQCQKLTA